MSLLDPADLADLASYIEDAFDKNAVFSRPTDSAPSSYGGKTPVGITRRTIAGRLRPSSQPRLVKRANAVVSEMVYLFRCALGSDIRKDDDVEIDGQTYTVLETDTGRSHATVLTATLIHAA